MPINLNKKLEVSLCKIIVDFLFFIWYYIDTPKKISKKGKTLPMKTIYLDMDGTCANLYAVDNWLDYLLNEDTFPYRMAEPMFSDLEIDFLNKWVENGNQVSVISWLCKNGSISYNKRVRAAKVRWLKKYLPIQYAEIHIIKYGTPKSRFGKEGDILIDDELRNLIDWGKDGKRLALSPTDFQRIVENGEEL